MNPLLLAAMPDMAGEGPGGAARIVLVPAGPHRHLLETLVGDRRLAGHLDEDDLVDESGVVAAGTVHSLELIVCDPAVTVNRAVV